MPAVGTGLKEGIQNGWSKDQPHKCGETQIGSVIGKWQPTILEVALNGVNEDTLERTIIHDSRSQCDFLLSPKLPNAADTIPPTKFDEIIKMLQYMYDIIVLDTSVEYTSELLGQFIYPMSDRIIFVSYDPCDRVVHSVACELHPVEVPVLPSVELHGDLQ